MASASRTACRPLEMATSVDQVASDPVYDKSQRAEADGWPTSVTAGTVADLQAADAVWLLSGVRGTAKAFVLGSCSITNRQV